MSPSWNGEDVAGLEGLCTDAFFFQHVVDGRLRPTSITTYANLMVMTAPVVRIVIVVDVSSAKFQLRSVEKGKKRGQSTRPIRYGDETILYHPRFSHGVTLLKAQTTATSWPTFRRTGFSSRCTKSERPAPKFSRL